MDNGQPVQAGINKLVNQAAGSELVDAAALDLAFEDLRCRSLEMAILCHPRIRAIAVEWDRLLGRHKDELLKRLKELGFTDIPDEVARFFLQCLGSFNARRNGNDSITPTTERDVIRQYSTRVGSDELRCECCGYHFRENDINSRRLATAQEENLRLCDFIDPRREEDTLKPISVPGTKDKYYTKLELDHCVPRAALGWGASDNVRLLCRFCNLGKSSYVRPLEPLSPILAYSLVEAYHDLDQIGRTIVTTVAALRSSKRTCDACDKANEVELTVRFREAPDASRWFVPWRLQVVCYDCKELSAISEATH